MRASEQGTIAGLMMSLAGLSFLAPPVIGVALYELLEPGPFIANAVLLVGAVSICFLSPALKSVSADIDGDGPKPDAPPASQPGPEGNR